MIARCSASGLCQEQDMQLHKYTVSIGVACGFISHLNPDDGDRGSLWSVGNELHIHKICHKKFVFRLCML
jgi:hypothetical protein